ncbi:MAG: hypothetical protein ACRDLY_19135, partial [Thermoleophilaceae bacterium]
GLSRASSPQKRKRVAPCGSAVATPNTVWDVSRKRCHGGGPAPVRERSLVGGLALLGERALCLAHPLAGREQPGVGALERLGAGADLEQQQRAVGRISDI